jgi:hypothetical protein
MTFSIERDFYKKEAKNKYNEIYKSEKYNLSHLESRNESIAIRYSVKETFPTPSR